MESHWEDLVRQGLLTAADLEKCREKQEELRAKGTTPLPTIGELLVQGGYLSQSHLEQTLQHVDESSSRQDQPEGNTIGNYTLLRRLGEGGMGEVFEAFDSKLRRKVALKILKQQGKEEREAFLQEARTAGNLNHPNIAQIFEVGEADGRSFIAMQFIEGKTLDLLPSDEPRTLVRFIHDAALALHHAHEKGVIHRDLKPANIMVEGDSRVFLLDFGLARTMEVDTSVSVSGTIVGTPRYMSPEQAQGRKSVGVASDLYSLGATLYALLTGQPPSEGKDLASVLHQIVHVDPISPRTIKPALDRDLETILLKCLEKEPDRRYLSTVELAADLKRWLSGDPILARPPSISHQIGRWARKRKSWVISSAVVLFLGATSWWGLWFYSHEQDFQQAKDRAITARENGEWKKAILESERAIQWKEDATLIRILEESRLALEKERQRIREEEKEARRYRWLQDRFKPIEDRILRTQTYLYVPGRDLASRVKGLEADLKKLQETANLPEYENYPEVWHTLGIGWYLVGDAFRAKDALERALQLAPKDGRSLNLLVKLYLLNSLTIQHSVLSEEKKGSEIQAKEWSAKALALTGNTATTSVEISELNRHLATAYAALANRDGALLKKLILEGSRRFKGLSGSEEYWILLAEISPTYEQKRMAYVRALERRPHYYFASQMLSICLMALKQPRSALETMNRALESFPRFANGYNQRAIAYFALGNLAKAEADLTEAIRINPTFPVPHFNRAIILGEAGKIEASIQGYTEVIRLDPNLVEAYYNRGNMRSRLNDRKGAYSDYNEAVRIDPSYAMAWNNRGWEYLLLQDYSKAYADFDRALQENPELKMALINRGQIKEIMLDFSGAIQDYRRALELASPDWKLRASVQEALERALRRRGK